VWVIVGFVLATLIGRQKLSSVHRYISNLANWLYEIIQTKKIKPISRAHLPRFLNGLSWFALNAALVSKFIAINLKNR